MIQGISHITFIVSDLDRMTDLLKTIIWCRRSLFQRRENLFNLERKILPGKWFVDCNHGRDALVGEDV